MIRESGFLTSKYIKAIQWNQNYSHLIQILNALTSEAWHYVTAECSSFVARDCNTKFSECFQKYVFYNLLQHEP